MGKIVIMTDEEKGNANKPTGAHIHIPEELWELARKHRIMVEDDHSGERYLLIDMTGGDNAKLPADDEQRTD